MNKYNFLLVTEKHCNHKYGYNTLFTSTEGKHIAIGHKIIYDYKLYEIIDVDVVYDVINNKAYIKETNVYIEEI